MSPIGFIGLGNMGRPMADNLVAAGFDLVCFDAAGTAERLPRGARAVADVAEMSLEADVVMMSVPDGAATRAVVDEVARVERPRVATVVDLSTVGPAVARESAARLGPSGITYCDGPVSGGVAGARAATLSLMFAGPAAVLDAHRTKFDAIARNVFHVGDLPGQGQAMKLLNNYLSASALAATSEAIAFGLAEGLEMALMIDVLNVSTGRNSATSDKFPNRILTGAYDAGFQTRLMSKDLALFLDSVGRTGTSAAVAGPVGAVWAAADTAMPGSDFTEIWKFVSGRGVAGSAARNEQLVRQFFATLSTGNLEALRPLIHADGSWEVMAKTVPGAGRTNGRDAVIDEFLAPVRGLFAPGDPKIDVKRTICVGNIVCAETEALGELSNGNRYHNRYAWVIEILDDMVCHLREYMDTAYIENVLS